VNVEQIFALLPEDLLNELAVSTDVNKYSKKLQGEVIFKLLIYSILSYKNNSLRTIKSSYESTIFGLLSKDISKKKISYSSISERLNVIDPEYFEKIYQACIKIYSKELKEQMLDLTRFDSTIVSMSGRLLKTGYILEGSSSEKRTQVKFTIGYSELPTSVQLFTQSNYHNENVALKEHILFQQPESNTVYVFDRGLNARKTFMQFVDKGISFITRIEPDCKHEVYTENKLSKAICSGKLDIYTDDEVYLYSKGNKKTAKPLRRIVAVNRETKEEIAFITNINTLTAEQVTSLYKRRWDIEVFFKFIKQELNFSHLINRSENGIKVMLYATLIAAILLLVYKKKNNLTGYKIMKLEFMLELEALLMKALVILCGGDPKLFEKHFGKPPS
jgi:hypothetical protein